MALLFKANYEGNEPKPDVFMTNKGGAFTPLHQEDQALPAATVWNA